MIRSFLIAVALIMAPGAQARMVTDHEGYRVEVPDTPQRIVSLHDWTLTVMVHELGAPLIASSGRLGSDGGLYMRGGRELFGLDFTKVELASVHGKTDLERIRALKPDLIVAGSGDNSALRRQLSSIAPTVMFESDQGRPMFELYEEFAGWIGRADRFEEMRSAYLASLDEARARMASSGSDLGTYAALMINARDGTLEILKEYGSLTTALDGLGFTRLPVIAGLPASKSRVVVGAEFIDALDADFIATLDMSDNPQPADAVYEKIERIAPGARSFLRAFASGRVAAFPRDIVYPPSFTGLEMTIQAIESRHSETRQ